MRLLLLDQEMAEIITTAAEAGEAIIAARARRVDPDGALGLSLGMSRQKIRHLQQQLQRPAALPWEAVPKAERARFLAASAAFSKATNEADREALWTALCALVFSLAHPPYVPPETILAGKAPPAVVPDEAPAAANAPRGDNVR